MFDGKWKISIDNQVYCDRKFNDNNNNNWGMDLRNVLAIFVTYPYPNTNITRNFSLWENVGLGQGWGRWGTRSKKSMVTSARFVAPFLSLKVFYHTVINYGYFFAYSMTRFLRLANTLSWYVVILLLPRYLRKTQGQ